MVFGWLERPQSIRVNATYDLFGKAIAQAEIISVLIFLGSAALLFWQLRKADQAAPRPPPRRVRFSDAPPNPSGDKQALTPWNSAMLQGRRGDPP
jgi:hypothetical protein